MFIVVRVCYLVFSCVLLFVSCSPKTDGFTCTESQLCYKLIALGDEERMPQAGDLLYINMELKDFSGRTLTTFSALEHPPLAFEMEGKKHFWELISMLYEGDSAACKVKTDSLPEMLNYSKVGEGILHMKLLKIIDAKSYALNAQFPGLIAAFPKEFEMVCQFFSSFDIDTVFQTFDMYFAVLNQGNLNRDKPQLHDKVNIDFEGFFIDGKCFDSTIKRKETFEYRIGEQGQVIEGIEKALLQMHPEGECLVLIPSFLAFGERGSTDGLIPENESLIYKIRLNYIEYAAR